MLFAAAQCLGYRGQYGPATKEMCLPSKDIIIKQLKRVYRTMKDVASIFVSSDSNHMIEDLKTAFKSTNVSFASFCLISSVKVFFYVEFKTMLAQKFFQHFVKNLRKEKLF